MKRTRDRLLELARAAVRGDADARADLAVRLLVTRPGDGSAFVAQVRRNGALRRMLDNAARLEVGPSPRGVQLAHRYGSTVIHRSTRPGALPWQATTLDHAEEPTGHSEHPTCLEGVLVTLREFHAAIQEVVQ